MSVIALYILKTRAFETYFFVYSLFLMENVYDFIFASDKLGCTNVALLSQMYEFVMIIFI